MARTKKLLYIGSILSMITAFLGCSTEPVQTGSIHLNFVFKNTQPSGDSLYPVYPNPFSRATGDTSLFLQFALRDTSRVNLVVQNALGDAVALFSDSLLVPGAYNGHWNPVKADGTSLLSGIYYVTLHAGDFINSRLVFIEENK